MADTRGQQDIFGLDIDKLAKGFGEQTYNFINEVTKNKMKGDSIRWFQKTAGTLSIASPGASSNVSPGAQPDQKEVSWTRNTSYKRTFFVEGTLDDEDVEDAEIDTFATTVRDLTEMIVRDRDAHLWDIMSEGQSPSEIQTFATTAIGGDQWDAASAAANIVLDLQHAKKLIQDEGYNPEGASVLMDTLAMRSVVDWLITGKGSSIPGFSSDKVKSGTVVQLLNLNLKVSLNVTTDHVLVLVPKRAVTYSESKGITATTTVNDQINRKIRIKTSGVAYRTDPKAIVLITDINT